VEVSIEVEVEAEGKGCISKKESWRIAFDGRGSVRHEQIEPRDIGQG